jgi:hypothetical protein
MVDKIQDAIEICDGQIDGEDDDYGKLWAEVRDTLALCLEKVGMKIDCPRCGTYFHIDEDAVVSRCPECELVIG